MKGYSATFANTGSGQGGSGTEDGQLNDPGQADVNSSTGDLYVADTANNRVQVFKATADSAEYDSQAPISEPSGLAVDQADGSVYVSTPSGVAKFDADLNPVIVGWSDPGVTGALAVDPSSGDLLVADRDANLVRRYESDGTAADSFAAEGSVDVLVFDRPLDLAVTASGQVLVILTTGNVITECAATSAVWRFSPTGTPEGIVGGAPPPAGNGPLAPASVAIDPDDGSIVVGARNNQYNCGSQPPYLAFLAADGTAGQTIDLPGEAAYGMVSGLASQGGGSGRVYAIDKAPFDDGYGATAVFLFEDLFPPEVTIATGAMAGTEAELKGSVDANGVATEYHFEYRDPSSDNWTSTPIESAGEGADPVAVSTTISGLEPASDYEAKLIATNADGEGTAGPITFETTAIAPVAETSAAAEVGPGSARLRARINPGGALTSYRFEWGTTTSYGHSVPLTPASAGAGNKPLAVSQLLSGLAPGTTYHFRVVAQSGEGESIGADQSFTTAAATQSCPNEAIRAEQDATRLPNCRAYEMVSPLAKGGLDVSGDTYIHQTQVTPDGNAVAYASPAVFADAPGGAAPNIYRAVRGATGWSTKAVSPPQESYGSDGVGDTSFVYQFTEDLSKAVVRSNAQLVPGSAFRVESVYLEDISSGTYDLLTPGLGGGFPAANYRDGTPDFRHIAVISREQLTPDAPAVPGWIGEFVHNAYVFSGGDVELVSYLPPSGETECGPPPHEACVPSSGAIGEMGNYAYPERNVRNAISDDGRYVYWESQPGHGLYLRDRLAETTVRVSRQNGEEGEDLNGVTFYAATPDGALALYSNTGEGLCIFNRVSGTSECRQLGLEYPAAISEDLSSIYFRAGASAGDGPLFRVQPGPAGDLSSADVTEVANLEGGAGLSNFEFSRSIASAVNGESFVFETAAKVDDIENGGFAQVYRYEAASGEVQCVSCPPSGAPSAGSGLSEFRIGNFNGGLYQPQFHQPRAVSADGSRVFFRTDQRLLPGDSNGVSDVYMWEDGDLSLISSGTSRFAAKFVEASASGDDVFIVTKARLSGHDTDDLADVYDVRVGGGFPEPVTRTACQGDGCQGQPPSPPLAPTAGSSQLSGPGNARTRAAGRRCAKSKRAVKKRGKTRCVKRQAKRPAKPSTRRNG